MKRIAIIILGLISVVYAQNPDTPRIKPVTWTPMSSAGYQWKQMKVDTSLQAQKLLVKDSAGFQGVTTVPIVDADDSSRKVVNTAWAKRNMPGTQIGAGTNACANYRVGARVSWNSLLIFDITAGTVCIGGKLWNNASDTVHLTAAHSTLNRFDVIAVDTLGQVVVITGTPAADPAVPQIDPSSQFFLTSIRVDAGATTPTGVSAVVLWNENIGSPEWTASKTGSATVNFNSTTTPYVGSKDTDAGSFSPVTVQRHAITYTGTAYSRNTYNVLKFFINLKAALAAGANIYVTALNGGVAVSAPLLIGTNQGFVKATFGQYQGVNIELSDFAWSISTTTIDGILIQTTGSGTGFYVDYITLAGGVVNYVQSPITLTTTGSSGAATLVGNNLNVPNYAGGGITALTGDVTASGTGSVAATLATVNSNVGSFTNANVTVNAKGLVTAVSNGSGGTSDTTILNVIDYGAKGDMESGTDGAISSGTAIFTSATVGFVSGDVGKTIRVSDAGAAGVDLITTIAGFTNSTTVTLTANASSTVTGKTFEFGTDNTAILQGVANEVPITGAVVRFPSGLYLINGAVDFPNPVKLQGNFSGRLNAIFDSTGTNYNAHSGIIQIQGNINSITIQSSSSVVEGLDFECTSENTITTGTGININASNVSIIGNTFRGFWNGVSQNYSFGWRAEHNTFSARNFGLYIRNLYDGDYGDYVITGNLFAGHGGIKMKAGIKIESSGGAKISDNKFNTQMQNGIDVHMYNIATSTSDIQIVNNSIENYDSSGITVKASGGGLMSNVVITGNQIAPYTSSATGINIDGTGSAFLKGIAITGNVIYSDAGGDTAIKLKTVEDATITSNTIYGSWTRKLYVFGSTAVIADGEALTLNTETSTGTPYISFQKQGVNKFQWLLDADGSGTADLRLADNANGLYRVLLGTSGTMNLGGDASSASTSAIAIAANRSVSLNTLSGTHTLKITGNTTSDPQFQVGGFVVQSYSDRNGFVANNTYFNGSAYKYLTTGEAAWFQFTDGVIYFKSAPSGTAGASATATTNMTVNNNGIVNISNTPSYADNAAALGAGLVAGDIYRTGDLLKIVH